MIWISNIFRYSFASFSIIFMTLSFTAAIVPPIEPVESIAMQILAFPADPEVVLKKNSSSRLILLSKIKFLFAIDSI